LFYFFPIFVAFYLPAAAPATALITLSTSRTSLPDKTIIRRYAALRLQLAALYFVLRSSLGGD
jgi:hypothetical protein